MPFTTSSYNPTFGSYTLPGRVQNITDDVAAELSTWKPSGRGGEGSEESLLAAKRVTILSRANYGSVALRDAGWEAIKAGLARMKVRFSEVTRGGS